MPFSPLLLSFYFFLPSPLDVLASAVSQEKEAKGIQTKNEQIKWSLCADDIIIYIENPVESTTKLLEVIVSLARL